VILGMHARKDNPELLKAMQLGLKIYSFPEFIYENSRDKKRVVIGGSHGKTTTTAMIMHVMKGLGKAFDYMAGSSLPGFETMVQLTEAPVIILEGDEYLSSPIDMRPKFHWYAPHIAMLTGIAWDHINVFPTFENYIEQFDTFIKNLMPGAELFYFEKDKNLREIASRYPHTRSIGYQTPQYHIDEENITHILHEGNDYPMQVFGEHNLENMEGARLVCQSLGIPAKEFYHAMRDFSGAAKRLELLHQDERLIVYRDFAHSPSKLESTVKAVRQQFKNHKLVAVFELHTFSSLDPAFLPLYKNAMDPADDALIFFDQETLKQKKKELNISEVSAAFGYKVEVHTDPAALKKDIYSKIASGKTVLLLMSSGTFGGTEWKF
jgi:UDP-N-acetylmuramate: L-alanyl-gamma-D-glutamyl-meso-diaminopimelate ligase